jgi:hypothetical protein
MGNLLFYMRSVRFIREHGFEPLWPNMSLCPVSPLPAEDTPPRFLTSVLHNAFGHSGQWDRAIDEGGLPFEHGIIVTCQPALA